MRGDGKPMKVLHVPFTYFPDPVGGTETYVRSLARGLSALGIDSAVCAPGASDSSFEHDGIRVHRFRTSFADASSLYGYPRSDVAAFDQILDTERPDLVHFHAFVGGLTPGLALQASRRRIPILYTYHTPTALCPRGDLLRLGEAVCQGLLDPKDCAACAMHAKGAPAAAIAVTRILPVRLKGTLARIVKGRCRTALTLEENLRRHKASFEDFASRAERMIAVCEWGLRLLRVNGVPDNKLLLCRHGVEARDHARSDPGGDGGPLKLLYAGRLSVNKGIDVAIKALRSLRCKEICLDIRGAAQSGADERYVSELKEFAGGDPRVRFLASYAPQETSEVMAGYDAVIVPSVWMETGPLVVLEAFAAGVPVLASNRGGMSELVTDGVDGLLLPAGRIEAWAAAIEGLALNPARLVQLKKGVRLPRSVGEVAADMRAVYRAAAKDRVDS